MATTRNTMPALMASGLRRDFYKETKMPQVFRSIFDCENPDKAAFETEQGLATFGTASQVREMEDVEYDDPIQGYAKVYLHTEWGLGYRVSRTAIDDDRYAVLGQKMSKNLGISCRYTQELLAATVLNNGFTDATGSPDGLPLFHTAHPLLNGGVYGNMPSVPAALSLTSLQVGINTMRKTPNDRGLISIVMPKKLVVPTELQFVAQTLMKTARVTGSNYNDINPIAGEFDIVVHDYLTNPLQWHLFAEDHDVKWYDREAVNQEDYIEQNTRAFVFKARFRCSTGFSGWRGVYGTTGA